MSRIEGHGYACLFLFEDQFGVGHGAVRGTVSWALTLYQTLDILRSHDALSIFSSDAVEWDAEQHVYGEFVTLEEMEWISKDRAKHHGETAGVIPLLVQ